MGVARRKKGCPAQIARAVPASNACGPAPPAPVAPIIGLTLWSSLRTRELSPYTTSGSAADYVNANPFCLLSQAQEVLRAVFLAVRLLNLVLTTAFDLRHHSGRTNPSLSGEHRDKNPSSYTTRLVLSATGTSHKEFLEPLRTDDPRAGFFTIHRKGCSEFD